MGEFSDFALVPEQGVVPQMAQLGDEMQQRIAEMASRLNVRDGAAVMGFGARAQKEMGLFSDMALARMLERDDAPLGEVRAAYERAEPRISACADEMLRRRVQLMQDSAMLERLYEKNESLYRELCSLLVVGDEAIRQARARGEAAETVARLERRVEDIRVTQLSSTQLAAQIRMVQGSDSVTCEKLKTAIDVTIPLWKSQMAAALGLARATDAMRMQSRMNAEAARGVRRSAKEMRAQTAAYAGAAAEDDRIRAQQTAEALLKEIEEIEKGLREKSALERSV